MSVELYWMSLTLLATAMFALPYVVERLVRRGIAGTLANPPAQDSSAAWSERAKRAHYNAIENIAVFAPAAIAVVLLQRQNGMTAIACELFFFARVLHYFVYTLGIPVARTLSYLVAWVATIMLILRSLGAL